MKIILITLLFNSLCFVSAYAQRNMADSSVATPLVGIQYGGNWTGGDLKDRYGYLNQVGFTAGYKFTSKWYLGLDADFMFGGDIRLPELFTSLKDTFGNITDQNGDIATVLTFARGFHANIEVGRLITVLSPNENSGIFLKFGGGYVNHRVRIETNDQVVPSLELDYKKGYDRLTTGFNTSQFIGYLFMADQGILNFYGGFYLQEGFTKNRRDVFFDQPEIPVSKSTRFDLQYGFKVGWLIPIYKRRPKEFYYN